MATMRAKFRVTDAVKNQGQLTLKMSAVTDKPFDPDGKSEDNDFARWTPCADLTMHIQNPALLDSFVTGQKFYLDFIEAQ